MRLSYNWIRELLPDMALTPPELAELLTAHSFETNLVGEYGVPAGVKTVQITKIEKHPKADRLQLATITAGKNEITLVCGAPNIKVGQIVPYSPPGVELKDENGSPFVIEAREIRGVMSEGMLNSLRELGLHHDHGGIWVLPEDTPVGQELAQLMPPDTLLEADITPNRAHDCLSHIGIAREIAALLRIPISEPVSPDLPAPVRQAEGIQIELENPRLSPRYLGAVVKNLHLAPSPLWLQARLLSAGGKPINNLVDVTNYVMFEFGNPAHLFDQATLPGKTIGVRAAKPKEKLKTLDGVERNLTTSDLVITADDKPVALAGIMGGEGDAVGEKTKEGFLEVANFNAFSVQETSRRLSLRTEASARFSKGLDPNLVATAAARTLGLLREIAEAEIGGVLDRYPNPVTARTLAFNPARVNEVAGSDIFTEKDTHEILTFLRCHINDKKVSWQVTVPTDRLDLEGEHDLVEEIIRVVGLDKIESTPPQLLTTHHSLPPTIYWREVVRDTLVELGLTETLNYSFTDTGELELANPPAPEKKYLRTSLMPGLLANLDKNRDAFHRLSRASSRGEPTGLFEIGRIYKEGEGGQAPGVVEEVHLAVATVGGMPSLSDIARKIGENLGIDPPSLENQLAATEASSLKYRLPIAVTEINLSQLLQSIEQSVPAARTLEEIQAAPFVPVAFTPLPKYPSVFRDVSMLVDPAVTVEQAQEVIERVGGELIADVDLFDEFEPRGQDQKSLAFHIEYRAPDRTLTDAEINPIHAKIITALESEIDAEIR